MFVMKTDTLPLKGFYGVFDDKNYIEFAGVTTDDDIGCIEDDFVYNNIILKWNYTALQSSVIWMMFF